MTEDVLHVVEWHIGDNAFSSFSDAEIKRPKDDFRGWMVYRHHACWRWWAVEQGAGWSDCFVVVPPALDQDLGVA